MECVLKTQKECICVLRNGFLFSYHLSLLMLENIDLLTPVLTQNGSKYLFVYLHRTSSIPNTGEREVAK